MKHSIVSIVLVTWFALDDRASADIVQLADFSRQSLSVNHAFGQTFTATADEPQVAMVSFRWSHIDNNQILADPTITVRLREGTGFLGAILATQTISSIPDSTPDKTWIDFNFPAPVPLAVGQFYCLHFTRDSATATSGGHYISEITNAYAGGTRLDAVGNAARDDLTFRVLSIAVPEPSAHPQFVAVALFAFMSKGRRLNRA